MHPIKTNSVQLFQSLKRIKRYGLSRETDQELSMLLKPILREIPAIQALFPSLLLRPHGIEFHIQWSSWAKRKDAPKYLYLMENGEFYFSKNNTTRYYRTLLEHIYNAV